MYDTHCHLPSSSSSSYTKPPFPVIPQCTNHFDLKNLPKIVNVGIHPWFCHLYTLSSIPITKEDHYNSILTFPKKIQKEELDQFIKLLPDPIPLQSVLDEIAEKLKDPFVNLGEIGLDKSFRLGHPNGGLSNFKVSIAHQKSVMSAQLRLNFKWVSIHCVNAIGNIVELLKDVKDPVVLHSYSGSIDSVNQLNRLNCSIWFGFSECINLNQERCQLSVNGQQSLFDKEISLDDKTLKLINTIGNRLLIESDLPLDCDHYNERIQWLSTLMKNQNVDIFNNWKNFQLEIGLDYDKQWDYI
ncbi:putative endodeoxyribonuclease [Martiniozyma asiatica (nom. inval.)]|nr:putative endodeoxyribonuclease [Martiniozyma asiatica]